MKYYPLLFLLIVLSCKKKDAANCRYTQSESYFNGVKQNSIAYSYDGQGRISRYITYQSPKNDTATYRYTGDSVVIDYGNIFSVYYLAAGGLATHSYTTLKTNNPNAIRDDQTYTYNANGYLVAQRFIFSQLYLGNIIRDTQYYYFDIAGGNVVKAYGSNMTDILYEYSGEPMDSRIPELNTFPSRIGAFLGKAPVNLIAVMKDAAGTPFVSYTYVRNKEGRITEKQVTQHFSTDKPREVYNYTCD